MNPSIVQIVKINSIILIFIILSFGLKAQGCLPEGITFSSQEQIDNFPLDYPGCTEIEGDVFIMNGQFQNFNGLMNISAIGGCLFIIGQDNLLSLSGLNNLATIGDYLYIENNYNLINFSGLGSLSIVNGDLTIVNNKMLENFEGLNNLQTVEGSFYISWNDNMVDFSGLESLYSIGGSLEIGINNGISSLSGLENLSSVGGSIYISGNSSLDNIQALSNIIPGTISQLIISNNPILNECNIPVFCEYLMAPTGSVNIYSNGVGCRNPSEIAAACGFQFQCLPYGNYFVTSQYEADNFTSIYPNCVDLKGHLIIGSSSLNYINGLFGIHSIEKDLIIQYNRHMNNLIGLESLIQVGGDLLIGYYESEGNLYLRNLEGLENLVNFDGDIQIIGNESLVNLLGLSGIDSVNNLTINCYPDMVDFSGLDNLTSIQGNLQIGGYSGNRLIGLEKLESIGETLRISGCDSLINLAGFDSLQFVNSLQITYNHSLQDLSGFNKLNYVHDFVIMDNGALRSLNGLDGINSDTIDYIFIKDNPQLSYCEIQNFCDYFKDSENQAFVSNNAPGCNTREEVEAACTVGQSELKQSDFCRIHPNPTSGLLRFSFILSESSKVRIEIVNSFGQEVPGPKPDFLSYGQHEIIWNAGHLPKGIYYYRIQIDSQTSNGRIILTD